MTPNYARKVTLSAIHQERNVYRDKPETAEPGKQMDHYVEFDFCI